MSWTYKFSKMYSVSFRLLLVGKYQFEASKSIHLAISKSDGIYLFPRYVRGGKCNTDHASAALNKWLKRVFGGLTAQCLRHTFRDRLRAGACPLELIDQIGV